MTDTTTGIPEYVPMVTPATTRSTAELAACAVGLLVEDLPQPGYFSISQRGQEISFQFGDTPESFRALAQWAERLGGTVTSHPHTHQDGRQSIYCHTESTADGVRVEAYAFITAGQTSST
jgi:hypothetical protein